MASILKIADVPPAVVGPTVTVLEAIEEMVRKRVGAVAVVQAGQLMGIFTERDVMLRVVLARRDPTSTKVVDVMTSKVEIGTEETTAGEALTLMLERHIRHLPIVDSKGQILGMLSIRNLLQNRVDDLSQQLDSLETYLTADGPGG